MQESKPDRKPGRKSDRKPDSRKETDSKTSSQAASPAMNKNSAVMEREKEEKHLQCCTTLIQKNIEEYTIQLKELSAETKELYDNYRSDNPELHNDLVIGLDLKSKLEWALNKNIAALKKPYFGRIDYLEAGDSEETCLYIGKKGIRRKKENIIIDWRAPISSVYYESDIGDTFYQTPFDEKVAIRLDLKRTYEIDESQLIDFYDSDVVANDEFLTKYLSKNKEVILGEIIATIQKEQNEIIRDTPWHSVIVQGVAGSGKTTVAMHRISYILYNYKDKFRPDEFFIIGSNRMLLNYITGVLPNLDVYNINQMTMEEFFLSLLDSDFSLKKNKYTLSDSFQKLRSPEQSQERVELRRFKGSLHFVRALEHFLKQYERNAVKKEEVIYKGKVVFSQEEMLYFINFFQEMPMQEKIDHLNKRLDYKITSINEEQGQKKEIIREEVKKFKNYFGSRSRKINLMEIYYGFLQDMIFHPEYYSKENIPLISSEAILFLIRELNHKKIDLYDLAMLTLIKKRMKRTKDFEFVSHIVIDEAQDFGVVIFHILKSLFPKCTFTIMGDVTQNIYYDTGMNDWEALRKEVFLPEKDRFYLLAKSYRNTVEISEFAGRVLKKCSFKTYDIEPIIRHGKEVEIVQCENENQMVRDTVSIIKSIQKEGYDTIAVICRTVEETRKVQSLLKPYVAMELPEQTMEEMTFTSGVMVLPIHMTKGLEFDAVLLWNPDEVSYRASDEDAKLLYVAITRALHELHIVYQGKLSKLLQ
jgi:DNA helicase-2/ATP-dependent DNA helicase PcrA